MSDSDTFVAAARRQGFSAEAAEAVLQTLHMRLTARGVRGRRFYGYRTASDSSSGAGNEDRSSQRSRLLLVFQSADTALGFAQRHRLGRAPRLVTLSLAQALTALLLHPAIQALLIADEPLDATTPGLPPGLRLDRTALMEWLASQPDPGDLLS